MKKAKVLILLLAIVLLATSCYSSSDLEEARLAGYRDGYGEGYSEGFDEGYETYENKSYEDGYKDAWYEFAIKTVETECPKCKNKFTIWAEDGTLYE